MRVMQKQKRLMALAGLGLFFYLIFHMVTNLSFFSAPMFNDFYNWYNDGLARPLILLFIVVVLAMHARTAFKIRRINAKARQVEYHRHAEPHIPAHYVTISIVFLLGFIVIHIGQMLWMDTFDVYQEMLDLFDSFWMLTFYMAGLFVLMMHMQHAMANVLQTLGKTAFTCQYLAWGIALMVAGGLAIVPLYIYFFAS